MANVMTCVADLVKAYNEEQAAKAAPTTPAFKPVAPVTPAPSFGTLKSLAGTDKRYALVFVQDHKIVTPGAILDGTALINACVANGGNPQSKYVQVRRNGYNNIHAQLPDEGSNRPYGTSFDFTDPALYALLG